MKIKIKPKEFEAYINRTDVLLTQRQFAKKAGVSEAQITNMKSRDRYGKKPSVNKILKAFPDLKFDDIFFVID